MYKHVITRLEYTGCSLWCETVSTGLTPVADSFLEQDDDISGVTGVSSPFDSSCTQTTGEDLVSHFLRPSRLLLLCGRTDQVHNDIMT